MGARWISGWFGGCALALAATALPSLALAQECATDADCDAGFVCESFGTVDCGFACPEGEACAPPPDCAPMEIKGCTPAPCTTDADCPADMVCFAQPVWNCPPVAQADCAPGSECPAQEQPAECTETTESTCVPSYVPPCVVNTDCGPGFTCVEQESCGCSGSAGAATPSGGSSEPAPADGGASTDPAVPDASVPEETCTCSPTGEFYCQLDEMPCASVSECPEGFTCEVNPNSVVCSRPTEPAMSGSGGAAGSEPAGVGGSFGEADGGAPSDAVDGCGVSTAPEMVCLPPYWAAGFAAGGSILEAGVASDAAGDGRGATATGAPTDPATASGEADMGAAGSSGSGGGTFCTVAVPGADARSGAAALVTLLALLGLAVLRSRRFSA